MVFLVHDINDIFMEAAKIARYAGHHTLCTVLFITFMLSWFASRIYYLPVYIIRSCLTEPLTVSISSAELAPKGGILPCESVCCHHILC